VRRHLRRLYARARDLWERAKRERSSPPEVAWSVAIGVFAACTPPLGLHMWIALALATAFRLNRLWAFLGSRATFFPIFVFVVFAEIEAGHRLRAGEWLAVSLHAAFDQRWGLLADWLLGLPIVACLYAALVGAVAYAVALRLRRLRVIGPADAQGDELTRAPPAPAPPPSSGSPPSAPRAPTA